MSIEDLKKRERAGRLLEDGVTIQVPYDAVLFLCTLIWCEYLVTTEEFDRNLPGMWKGGEEGGTWLVAPSSLHKAVTHSVNIHGRAVQALEKVLGRPHRHAEEAERVKALLDIGHGARKDLIGSRSVITEILG